MAACGRNIVVFHVFWEEFNTIEAHRSRFCIQKWSLEGELINCPKKLQNPWKPRLPKTLIIYPHPDAWAGTCSWTRLALTNRFWRQNLITKHEPNPVQKLSNCQWMAACCRNIVTFRAFWEEFNTFEAHRSRFCIQKWSLEGELIHCTKKLKNLDQGMQKTLTIYPHSWFRDAWAGTRFDQVSP